MDSLIRPEITLLIADREIVSKQQLDLRVDGPRRETEPAATLRHNRILGKRSYNLGASTSSPPLIIFQGACANFRNDFVGSSIESPRSDPFGRSRIVSTLSGMTLSAILTEAKREHWQALGITGVSSFAEVLF